MKPVKTWALVEGDRIVQLCYGQCKAEAVSKLRFDAHVFGGKSRLVRVEIREVKK